MIMKLNFLIQHSVMAGTKKKNSALLNRVKTTESEEKQKSKQQKSLNHQIFQQK